ncbi:DnaA N-terminal domain-containing protein [Aneurinibacillus danicus]|jgi:chromosomal replication initiator protein|uniref:DnaA N-terminal domain-containing protein n=1 Tax=Aneurinibacillus danicus TaxID=267746 RepID=A0A511VCX7_9BACL|nr:DnaA N-terminal domain-containing protein [Aneurinibacillus danicus]GEN35798.1 hypothetical protein ADA01nite_32580 [Aneurinibacillus danicus]
MDKQRLWEQVLDEMESRISKPSFETWVAKTRIETIDEEKGYIVVEAPNEFTADWLDSRYRDELE